MFNTACEIFFLIVTHCHCDGNSKEKHKSVVCYDDLLFTGDKITSLGEQTVMNLSMHPNLCRIGPQKTQSVCMKVIYCEKVVFTCQQRFHGDRFAT